MWLKLFENKINQNQCCGVRAEEQVNLSATLTNDEGEETPLTDEAKDIMDSFKLQDQHRGLKVLHDKMRALIRRSDLEVSLKVRLMSPQHDNVQFWYNPSGRQTAATSTKKQVQMEPCPQTGIIRETCVSCSNARVAYRC